MPCNIYQTVRYIGLSKKNVQDIIFAGLKFLKSEDKEVSAHLAGDKLLKSINKDYRGIDKTTDVLAFAIQDPSTDAWQEKRKRNENDLGDIFVSIPQIKRQAKAQGIEYKKEFVMVLAHGLLHLRGYDHDTKQRAKRMFGLQEKIANKICI